MQNVIRDWNSRASAVYSMESVMQCEEELINSLKD